MTTSPFRRVPRLGSLLLCAALLAIPAAAQDVLPGGFAGWVPGKVEKFPCANLAALVGDDAAALREYGCRAAERREYRKGDAGFTVAAVRMQDSTAAYGAFHYRRAPGMHPSPVAELAATGTGKTIAVAGDVYFETAELQDAQWETDLRELVKDLQARSQSAAFPSLVQYLPQQGRVPGSERFVLGPVALGRFVSLSEADWVGFDQGAEVQLAEYRAGGQDVTLLLAQYPTPQIASARLEGLRRWFNVNGQEEVVAGRPVVFAKRESSLVAVVAKTSSQNLADSLLQQVRYETQVTLNEPGFTATDPTWGEMVVGIFYGTGIIMGFALVAGLAFGGIRLIVKRLLPGKIFDRESSVEILQLGLGSKPIEGKDFYQGS